MASTARGGNHRNQGQSLQCTSRVESVLGEVHQNICSGSILQKTPCLEQLKLEEAEIWTRLWEGGGEDEELAGNEANLQLAPSKNQGLLPTFTEDTPPPWPPPNRHFLHPLLVPQGSSLSVSKALFVDVEAKARLYKCTPHQDKQAPVQRLS